MLLENKCLPPIPPKGGFVLKHEQNFLKNQDLVPPKRDWGVS